MRMVGPGYGVHPTRPYLLHTCFSIQFVDDNSCAGQPEAYLEAKKEFALCFFPLQSSLHALNMILTRAYAWLAWHGFMLKERSSCGGRSRAARKNSKLVFHVKVAERG